MKLNLIIEAAQFAREAHAGIFRKYTGEPYDRHLSRVSGRVAQRPNVTEFQVAAGSVHDVVEDTNHTLEDIEERFGPMVASLVNELTNPSKGMEGSREERKRVDREHLATVSEEAKEIKLLDRIDNVNDMGGAPNDFKELYAAETLTLIEAMNSVHLDLIEELKGSVNKLLMGMKNEINS